MEAPNIMLAVGGLTWICQQVFPNRHFSPELMPLRTALTRLYAAIFDPRQHRLFGDPIVCHVQPVQARWTITAWDNCDFGYPGDFETLDGLVTFVDNLVLRRAPARLCYLINPWPDIESPANF